MERWCQPPALVRAGLLLLLLLLLLLAGCWGAAPPDPGAPCAASATCPSGGPRLPRQAPQNLPQLTTTKGLTITGLTTTQNPASPFITPLPFTCGNSHEPDPTLRDPEAIARRWPWVVSVRANRTHVCAGTLIAAQWVLTVAHCLAQDGVTYSVRVGSPWLDTRAPTTADVGVQEVIRNSWYRAQRYWSWVGRANNIALLRLERALNYSPYVWPICLPGLDYQVADQALCTVAGWGRPRARGLWPQFRTIQEREVTVLNNKECDSFYHQFAKIPSLIRVITSQMVCVQDTDRKDFCYETSGEPLSCPAGNTWILVGMVSWGPGCDKSEAPPIYLRVSAYQHWVWQRIRGQGPPAPPPALLLALALPLGLLAAR